MKRFIFSVLAVTAFSIGLGALAERAGAGSKSDEKALTIIRAARQAIGGDAAITNVSSMVIAGQTTRTIKIEGVEKTVQGETEIALQLPDKLVKRLEFKHGDGKDGDKVEKHVNVVVVGDKRQGQGSGIGTGQGEKRIVIKKDDGTVQEYRGAEADKIIAADMANGADGKKIFIKKHEGDKAVVDAEIEKARANGHDIMIKRVGGPEHEAMRHNEMLRLTLSLLLTAPQGMDVSYTFGGETDVDGAACNIVVAEFGGQSFKLFIGRSSNLPVMMSYMGHKMHDVLMFRTNSPEGDKSKETVTFTRKVDAPPMAEFNVKFSDYRSVNGVQLPFRWVQTVGGAEDQIFDVSRYEINPANIADKFKHENMKVKVRAPEVQ